MIRRALPFALLACVPWTVDLAAQAPPGESPALTPPRITQAMIHAGLPFAAIRKHGERVFAAPFNALDGFGDGPMNKPGDPTSPGGRPTLQNNGTSLRINGLDAQSCLECHSVLSTAAVPMTFAVGGVGGISANAMPKPTEVDIDDSMGLGYAFYNGRYINPPFLFGSGGVELVGKEMTADLQALKVQAMQQPGVPVRLVAKGVDFGVLLYENGSFDTSGIEGIDEDLVVRPFGRKGEFISTRDFDVGALQFHMGMQPAEIVGAGVDDDGDGVVDEITVGELSALSIFSTTLPTPVMRRPRASAQRGDLLFMQIGCATCHVGEMHTTNPFLRYAYPEVAVDPAANVYYAVDLRQPPMMFRPSPQGGVRVPMFSDLKRHDMGPQLAESTGGELDPLFITARLWGIADTAPYLHDGRALTLTDAILMHGGEAQAARDGFAALGPAQKVDLLNFLRTLRTPMLVDGER